MSVWIVYECTRTVGVVHIPHAVCARHLRYVYAHARFQRCLYTYGCSLTGTDDWGRSDAIASLEDGVCTLTARPDGMPTRGDGHRRCVYTKVRQPSTGMCLCHIIKAARTWFLLLGLYMLVRALVRMHVSHWLAQYSISIWIYLYYIYLLYGLTTPNASPIEIHVKCLNSTGRFYFFLPSPLSSVAYHNEAWTVHFQKQLR